MASLRIPARALVVVLMLALATPAFADAGTEDKRAASTAKKAEAAAKLDAAQADDDALESAVRALDAGVQVQSATTDAAQRSLKAAETTLGSAQARLAATEAKMADLRQLTAGAAVRAYVHPGGDTLLDIIRSKDIAEASRRQTLLAHVVAGDRDVVDQMRSVRQDEQLERENLAGARDLAAERKKVAADKLAALQKTRADQARLKSVLDARIEEYTSEVSALAREEATLSAAIKSGQAAAGISDSKAGGGAGSGGGATTGSGVAWPTNGTVTSPFGYRWGALHPGIDIANGTGTPIHAAKAGTVVLAGWNGGYGNCIVIDHGNGFSTLYGHMSRLRASVGQTVKQGELIGDMGSTGNSTGPHLHFETRVGGTPQDPTHYLS